MLEDPSSSMSKNLGVCRVCDHMRMDITAANSALHSSIDARKEAQSTMQDCPCDDEMQARLSSLVGAEATNRERVRKLNRKFIKHREDEHEYAPFPVAGTTRFTALPPEQQIGILESCLHLIRVSIQSPSISVCPSLFLDSDPRRNVLSA